MSTRNTAERPSETMESAGALEMSDDTRDKVIALETDVRHFREQLDKIERQVGEMHNLLTQAKGARWAILSVVAVGGFIAGKLGSLLPVLNGSMK